MEFESYAERMEDLILYCALKDVDKGFYIDIGANHPVDNSVTKIFYDMGWHGINIEPINNMYAELQAQRPRDINLCIGIGAEHGELEFYEDKLVSTFSAENAVRLGIPLDRKKPKPVWTLSEVYELYPPPSDIHFCKIDVENYEREVLLGIKEKDWRKFRPWVFAMESTLPRTRTFCHENWEYILLENEYIFACQYDINRFYVAAERAHLLDNFSKIKQFVSENKVWKRVRGLNVIR